jgi:hypothetical protein
MLEVKRSLSGLVAYAVLLIALVCWLIAFFTPYWLENDFRIYGSRFNRLGLWVTCFNSLPDPEDFEHHRFFVGCRWVFDPFTAGYPEIRGYLMPGKFRKAIYQPVKMLLLVTIILLQPSSWRRKYLLPSPSR